MNEVRVSLLRHILEGFLIATSLILTLLILLHKGRGGGLSDMFGGGASSNLGSSGVAEPSVAGWLMKWRRNNSSCSIIARSRGWKMTPALHSFFESTSRSRN